MLFWDKINKKKESTSTNYLPFSGSKLKFGLICSFIFCWIWIHKKFRIPITGKCIDIIASMYHEDYVNSSCRTRSWRTGSWRRPWWSASGPPCSTLSRYTPVHCCYCYLFIKVCEFTVEDLALGFHDNAYFDVVFYAIGIYGEFYFRL